MDHKRFDALARSAANGGSRRGFLKGLFAVAAGLGVQKVAHAAKTTTTTTSAPVVNSPNVSPGVCADVCKSTKSSQKERQKCGCGATTTPAPTTTTTSTTTTAEPTTTSTTTTARYCTNGSTVCTSSTDCTGVPNSACIDVGGISVCLCPDGTHWDDTTRSCLTNSGGTGTAGCQSAYDTTNPSNCDVQVCKTTCSGGQTVVGTCALGYDSTTWVCAGENKAGVYNCTTDTDCTNVSAVYTKCIVLSPSTGAKACAVDCNN